MPFPFCSARRCGMARQGAPGSLGSARRPGPKMGPSRTGPEEGSVPAAGPEFRVTGYIGARIAASLAAGLGRRGAAATAPRTHGPDLARRPAGPTTRKNPCRFPWAVFSGCGPMLNVRVVLEFSCWKRWEAGFARRRPRPIRRRRSGSSPAAILRAAPEPARRGRADHVRYFSYPLLRGEAARAAAPARARPGGEGVGGWGAWPRRSASSPAND